MTGRHHVTVVGAGIVGVCAGLALLRDGHDVTIIDRDGPGENCSFGNAGMICDTSSALPLPSWKVVRDIPGMLTDRHRNLVIRWSYLPSLAPWLAGFLGSAGSSTRLANARAFHALLDGTTAAYDRLAAGTGCEDLIRKRGLMIIYETERGYEADARERALLAELGVEASELGAGEVRQGEPALSEAIRHASFLPGCYHTPDPHGLTRGLAGSFVAEGGRIEQTEVTGVRHGSGRVDELRTSHGDRKIDRLVIAAGAWSHRIAAMMGVRVLLDTERGYHAVFHGVETGLSRPAIHGEHKFGLNQMNEGMRFAGTVELAGLDAAPRYERADVMVDRGHHVLRSFDRSSATRVTRWMGRRPTLPDYLPALGAAPGLSNTWFDFGHQHLGLTLAARSALVVADLVAGRDPGLDLHAFRADRF